MTFNEWCAVILVGSAIPIYFLTRGDNDEDSAKSGYRDDTEHDFCEGDDGDGGGGDGGGDGE